MRPLVLKSALIGFDQRPLTLVFCLVTTLPIQDYGQNELLKFRLLRVLRDSACTGSRKDILWKQTLK